MAETENLKLYTEDSGNVTFQEWRNKIAGETNSNMTKLDDAIAGKQDKFSSDDTLTLKDGVLGVSFPNKAITKAEYDALSEEEKMADVQYIITDDDEDGGVGSSSLYEQFKEQGYTGTEEEFRALIASGPWLPTSGGTLTGNLTFSDGTGAIFYNRALVYDNAVGVLACVPADQIDYASPDYAPFACAYPTNELHAATKKYVDDKVAAVVSPINLISITFGEASAFKNYTVSANNETYTGTVPENLQALVAVKQPDTEYTVTCGSNSAKIITGYGFGPMKTVDMVFINCQVYVTVQGGTATAVKATSNYGEVVFSQTGRTNFAGTINKPGHWNLFATKSDGTTIMSETLTILSSDTLKNVTITLN